MTTSEVSDDPFVEHLRRDPLPNAGIRIILLTQLPPESAEAIGASLADLVGALGTACRTRRGDGRRSRRWLAHWNSAFAELPCRWCS